VHDFAHLFCKFVVYLYSSGANRQNFALDFPFEMQFSPSCPEAENPADAQILNEPNLNIAKNK